MSLIFSYDGDAGYSGGWSTITSARSFDSNLLSAPANATHRIRYDGGATAGLVIGETLEGGTSSATCVLVAVAIENNVAAGSADAGWLWVNNVSGTFQAETLTGSVSTGTVDIYQDLLPIVSYSPPKACLLTVETADIRFCLDGTLAGTTALSSMGHIMSSGQSYAIKGLVNIKKFSAINAVNGSGSVIKYTLFY